MSSRYVTGPLAFLQFTMLVVKGGCWLLDCDLSWVVVLWPLWTLLSVAVVFWAFFAAVVSKAG